MKSSTVSDKYQIMQRIQTYLYANKLEVQFLDSSINGPRSRRVYSRPVTIYQGVDNPIQVSIKNQEQRPFNVTGYLVQADLQDPANRVTVESFAVTMSNASRGLGSFVIDRDTSLALDQRFYHITFKAIKTSDNSEQPMYMDDNFGAPVPLEVREAYYAVSQPAPSVDDSILDAGTLE